MSNEGSFSQQLWVEVNYDPPFTKEQTKARKVEKRPQNIIQLILGQESFDHGLKGSMTVLFQGKWLQR